MHSRTPKYYCPLCGNPLNEYDEPLHFIREEIAEDTWEDMERKPCLVCEGKKNHSGSSYRFGFTGLPDNYHLDKNGRVWRLYKNKSALKYIELDKDGYPSIQITFNGKRKRLRLHRIVAAIKHGQKPPDNVVRHKKNNRKLFHPDNLEYGTQKENMKDKKRI